MTAAALASAADIARAADRRGALWMTAAMAGFAVEDALVKTAAHALPVAQTMAMFGLGGALVFAIVARAQGSRLMHPDVLSPAMRIRFGFELAGRLFWVLALALIPLSAATSILQATPIVVVAGAALVFGETVGPRRWAAILAGLVGVLIILRPTGEDFSLLSLLAVAGMLGFAGRDLASRAAPRTLAAAALGFWGFLTIVVAGGLYALWEGRAPRVPTAQEAAALAGAALVGTAAYGALMMAMRTGAVAAVTPFRYTRLLFGIGLGAAAFGERPDLWMLLGCAVVVASGVFLLTRRTD